MKPSPTLILVIAAIIALGVLFTEHAPTYTTGGFLPGNGEFKAPRNPVCFGFQTSKTLGPDAYETHTCYGIKH